MFVLGSFRVLGLGEFPRVSHGASSGCRIESLPLPRVSRPLLFRYWNRTVKLQIARADPSVDALKASALLRQWFTEDVGGSEMDWEEDRGVLSWIEKVGA